MVSLEVLIAAFLAIMLLASLLSLRAKVPYTLVLVFVGIALVAISASFQMGSGPVQSSIQSLILSMRSLFDQLISSEQGGLFVGLIVPPLLFETMVHIRSSDLKAIIRPSFFLATLGVLIATVVGGLVLWQVAGLSIYVSFLFAALISPTDAATVLEIFKRLKVPSKLSALMDTEAGLNDATGIVLFTIVLTSITYSRVSISSAITSFVIVFFGGVLVGLVVAFIAELISSKISDKLTQVILTISAVYGSYTLATSLGLSGLVAVSAVGLYFGNYTIRTTMGPATREAVITFWEFAAFLGNSVAFLFIGFRTDITVLASPIVLESIGFAFLAVTAARIASVYPILTVFDRIGERIPVKWRNVAVLGGMRGALSIALAASIPVTLPFITQSDSDKITAMVLGVAFISLTVQAAALTRYIKKSFVEEQSVTAEALNVRLSKAISAIESLQKMKEENKISDEEFRKELDKDKDELSDVLNEINANVGARTILKSRTAELYSSVVTLPMSKAMQILKLNKMSNPIESIIGQTQTPAQPEPDKKEEQDSKESHESQS